MRCISECATPESSSAGPRTIRQRRERLRGTLRSEVPAPLKIGPALDDLVHFGIRKKQPVYILRALGEIGTPCSRFKTVSQSSFPELSEFSDRCSEPGRGPKAGQSRRLRSIDQTRGAKPARQGPDIRDQLHGLAIHYQLRIQEIKKQMVADEQESVAPVIVRVRFHAVLEKNQKYSNL